MAQTFRNFVRLIGDHETRLKLSATQVSNHPPNWEWVRIQVEETTNDEDKVTLWEFFSRGSPDGIDELIHEIIEKHKLDVRCTLLDLSAEFAYLGSSEGGRWSGWNEEHDIFRRDEEAAHEEKGNEDQQRREKFAQVGKELRTMMCRLLHDAGWTSQDVEKYFLGLTEAPAPSTGPNGPDFLDELLRSDQ